VRKLVANEDRIIVVRGPLVAHPSKQDDGRALHTKMTRRLERMCTSLHVGFVGWDEPPVAQGEAGGTLGDNVHTSAEAHARIAEEIGEAMISAWLATHGDADAP